MVANFITCEVTKDNFRAVFEKYLKSGDLLLDFADTVGTKDICDWCAENNIM
jgi:homospermidine synthase